MSEPSTLSPMPQPEEHFCLLCERAASFGVKLSNMPPRTSGKRRGDGAFGYAWYCAVHFETGRALLRRERSTM